VVKDKRGESPLLCFGYCSFREYIYFDGYGDDDDVWHRDVERPKRL
jgi:hypothetical protein